MSSKVVVVVLVLVVLVVLVVVGTHSKHLNIGIVCSTKERWRICTVQYNKLELTILVRN